MNAIGIKIEVKDWKEKDTETDSERDTHRELFF